MELIGKLKIIGELQTFPSGFTKIQSVITSKEQFPQDIPVEFLKDKVEYLDGYKVGDDVKISINLRGSEYQGKYYLSANAWRIEKIQSEDPEQYKATSKEAFEPTADFIDDGDPLPF